MTKKHFDEIKVGDKFISRGKTVTETAIVLSVGLSGMTAPYFNDADFAKSLSLGWQAAPGRMTLMLMGGLEEQVWDEVIADPMLLAGFNNVKFKAGVKAGDTLKVEMEIIEKRETKKPGQALLIHKSTCKNQRGEVVLELENVHLVSKIQ